MAATFRCGSVSRAIVAARVVGGKRAAPTRDFIDDPGAPALSIPK